MTKKQTVKKSSRSRSYARNRAAVAARVRAPFIESDSTYFLKLVIIVILGAFWIRMAHTVVWQGIPLGVIPAGLLIGLLLISLAEKDQTNRKIGYAVLVVVAVVSNFIGTGVVI